jgi:hypothetical protein
MSVGERVTPPGTIQLWAFDCSLSKTCPIDTGSVTAADVGG